MDSTYHKAANFLGKKHHSVNQKKAAIDALHKLMPRINKKVNISFPGCSWSMFLVTYVREQISLKLKMESLGVYSFIGSVTVSMAPEQHLTTSQ